MAAIAVL